MSLILIQTAMKPLQNRIKETLQHSSNTTPLNHKITLIILASSRWSLGFWLAPDCKGVEASVHRPQINSKKQTNLAAS